MKRIFLLATLAASTLGAAVPLDKLTELKARMDTLQDTRDDLRDALDAKDGTKAQALSSDVVKLLQQDEALWQAKGLEDILAINRSTAALATQVGVQAKAGQDAQALKTYGDLLKSCAACHDQHPEKRL